jgi:hypothetical protein
MRKEICFLIVTIASAFPALAQRLPAAGNRLKHVYFCNMGTDSYPARVQQDAAKTTEEIQPGILLRGALSKGEYYPDHCSLK